MQEPNSLYLLPIDSMISILPAFRDRFFWTIVLAVCGVIAATGCRSKAVEAFPKVECRTPNGKRKPVQLHQWKFERIREAVLDQVPVDGKQIAYEQLLKKVEKSIPAEEQESIGKISWFVQTVVLELETRGELERFPESDEKLPDNLRRKAST